MGDIGMGRFNCHLLIILILSIVSPPAYGDNSEHWNDIGLSRQISSRFTVSLSNRSKFIDIPFNDIYNATAKLGIGIKAGRDFTISPSYRIDWIEKAVNDEYEHRYCLQFDYKKTLSNITLTLTQITELRYFTKASKDHVRLRLRMNVSKSIGKIANLPSSAYMTPEIFYDDNNDDFSRLRLYSGFDFTLRESVSLRIGYIFQNEKGKPVIHILNSGLNFSIK